jgi:hypothetical protein
MARQDRWWLTISIVWIFVTVGVLLYLGFAGKGRQPGELTADGQIAG